MQHDKRNCKLLQINARQAALRHGMTCAHYCNLYTKQIKICFSVQNAHVNGLHTHFSILCHYLLPFFPYHFTNNIFSTPHTECVVASLKTPLGNLVINTEMKMRIDTFWTDGQSSKNKSTLMDNK